jgi:hypothetical protein
MSITVKTGVAIGVVTFVWTLVMGGTGWYLHPTLAMLFFLVVIFEIGLLYWGLRQTGTTQGYGQQVVTGTAMAAFAAPIVFAGSMIFTSLLFPSYFTDLRDVQRQLLQQQGLPPDEIQRQVEAAMAMQTPVVNAATGAIATIVTGALASALIAIGVRRKSG